MAEKFCLHDNALVMLLFLFLRGVFFKLAHSYISFIYRLFPMQDEYIPSY